MNLKGNTWPGRGVYVEQSWWCFRKRQKELFGKLWVDLFWKETIDTSLEWFLFPGNITVYSFKIVFFVSLGFGNDLAQRFLKWAQLFVLVQLKINMPVQNLGVSLTYGSFPEKCPNRPFRFTPLKTNMSPENQWFEDVFPTKIVHFLGTC